MDYETQNITDLNLMDLRAPRIVDILNLQE